MRAIARKVISLQGAVFGLQLEVKGSRRGAAVAALSKREESDCRVRVERGGFELEPVRDAGAWSLPRPTEGAGSWEDRLPGSEKRLHRLSTSAALRTPRLSKKREDPELATAACAPQAPGARPRGPLR